MCFLNTAADVLSRMTPNIKAPPNTDVSFCCSFLPADNFTLNSTVKMWKGMCVWTELKWILIKCKLNKVKEMLQCKSSKPALLCFFLKGGSIHPLHGVLINLLGSGTTLPSYLLTDSVVRNWRLRITNTKLTTDADLVWSSLHYYILSP